MTDTQVATLPEVSHEDRMEARWPYCPSTAWEVQKSSDLRTWHTARSSKISYPTASSTTGLMLFAGVGKDSIYFESAEGTIEQAFYRHAPDPEVD